MIRPKKVKLSKNFYYNDPNIENVVFDKRTDKQMHSLQNTDTKINIYEDRVNTWFLKVAQKLKMNREAGFVILSIAVAYIEGNQQFREGVSSHNKSKTFFIKGMRRIFDKEDVPEKVLLDYYQQIRCGLFHDGMTRKSVFIMDDLSTPISYNNGLIKINSHKFFDKIDADFKEYIAQLKVGNPVLKQNFEKRWALEQK